MNDSDWRLLEKTDGGCDVTLTCDRKSNAPSSNLSYALSLLLKDTSSKLDDDNEKDEAVFKGNRSGPSKAVRGFEQYSLLSSTPVNWQAPDPDNISQD